MDKYELVAEMLRKFPGWGNVSSDDLRMFFRGELGGENVFDEGIRLGNCRRIAIRPKYALLVCAGTFPHPSWQAMARLALVETERLYIKLPDSSCSDMIADAARWMGAKRIFSDVEISHGLPVGGLGEFDVVLVYGSSETVSFFRDLVPWNKKFLGFGNKVSLVVVNGRDVHLESAHLIVRDVLAFSQQGCLAPHVCYVCDGDANLMGSFCARAFKEAYASGIKIPQWDVVAASRIFTTRRAETAVGSEIFIPEDGSLAWTVVVSLTEDFEISPTHQVLRIKRCNPAEKLTELLKPWRDSLSTIALSPNQPPPAGTGASRFCALGCMQQPSLFWSQDGYCPLAELVTWVSYEDNLS